MKIKFYTVMVYDVESKVEGPSILSKRIVTTVTYRADLSTLTPHEFNFSPYDRLFWTPFAFVYVSLVLLLLGGLVYLFAERGINEKALKALPGIGLFLLFVFGFGYVLLRNSAIKKKAKEDVPDPPAGATMLRLRDGSSHWYDFCANHGIDPRKL